MVESIKKIIILGGGSAGWMTAAALGKLSKQTGYKIQVIESEDIGTIGVGESSLTALRDFNRLLGIDENEFIKQTNATFKMGIKFVDWGKLGSQYHHAFGQSGSKIGAAHFHHYWLKMQAQGKASPYENYTLNALASEEKRFMRAVDAGNSPLSDIDYGFHLDSHAYAQYLSKLAQGWGVQRTEGKVVKVLQDEHDFISALTLADGSQHSADFFIDCTGFNALLIDKTLHSEFDDWGHWLPCDRAITVASKPTETPWSYTQATAQKAGWQWRIPLQHRVGNGHVYASKFMSDDEARSILLSNIDGELLSEPKLIHYKSGYRKKSWQKNCLAIGLSAGFVEPLESTGLHMIHAAIERLIAHFPNKHFAVEDIDHYNHQTQYQMECIRDFLIVHYCATNRDDSDFWNYCRTMTVPAEVSKKIELFKQNGRIVRFDDNMYGVSSWFQVLNGQGLQPNSYDPLVNLQTDAEIMAKMDNIVEVIRDCADYMPEHQTFINRYCKAN